ncbi:STAT transcription factor [Trema orientale]|uniref:STAT transcription factor n=1 Tax=Trema orientale TaxID=63057 RepID=A0A2P5FL97_TREOI|nr:STAT transcription factor [Trema orientale]
MGVDEAMEGENYSVVKDLRVEIDTEEGSFSLCFWIYLTNSTTFPVTVLQEVHPNGSGNYPFLVINLKKVMLFPLLLLHKEAQDLSNPTSSSGVPQASVEIEFPLEKWVHFGCEVLTDCIRLHIDGEIVGEKPLSSIFEEDSTVNGSGKITLVSGGRDEASEHGYIYNLKILPTTSSIKDHFAKDPPVQLSIDKSSASEIEEGQGGVWSIVGGKASCRRNFSLDVVFFDTSGQPVSKEMEVVASLSYLDNGAPVERTSDGEAPLLASYDGIEFASYNRPSKLLHGRASFKLKISQLSSKCQNRLFRIRFHLPNMERYPFFEAFSPPIRSISRNRNTRVSSMMWKRSTSVLHPVSQSSGLDEDMLEVEQNSLHEMKPNPSSKRFRLGQDRISTTFRADPTLEPPDEECNSHALTTNKVEDAFMTSSTVRPENFDEDNSSSDSESTEARNSAPKSTSSTRNPISDMTIFKYCLAGLTERSLLLKDIANSASNKELLDFAHQVSLYSGCSHHRNQIIMAKKLVEDGTKAWNSISQNNNRVQWESVVFEIEEHFMKIASCSSRSLTQQDFELLRKIAGCQEYVAQENFEQMWCWLYPVAYTISTDWINAMWSSTSPRWIEGFVTKEEAESSLQGPRSVQEPGTFILRFPTSRSWPHPDAGSLVVTYIGCDYTIHHKLLSLDHLYSSSVGKEKDVKPLQDMLLEEPELSRLGRIIRSH